jgi:hypothetical protein
MLLSGHHEAKPDSAASQPLFEEVGLGSIDAGVGVNSDGRPATSRRHHGQSFADGA